MNSRKLFAIVGPTAVGKTAVSIAIAKELKTEILSFDSRQFYKELRIGTAKPTEQEMSGTPHHFVNSHSIQDHYTSGQFEHDAIARLSQLFQSHEAVVAVGGSGLFLDAITHGFDENIPEPNTKIRSLLMQSLEENGLEALQLELKEVDPDYYYEADTQNPHRVVRALEVYQSTGIKYSSLRVKSKKERNFEVIKIGIQLPRVELYERINMRVDQMISGGLLEEVKILESEKGLSALNAVGYKEIFDHLEGKISMDEAIELIKRNSRRYAKRQITWFNRDKSTKWFSPNQTIEILLYLDKILG